MKHLIPAATLSLLAIPAMAADDQGWHVGAAASFADFEWDNDIVDDSSTGAKLFGGYQFNRWFSLEGAYHTFGDFEEDTPGVSTDVEVDGYSVAGLFHLPLPAGNLSAFAKAGFYDFDQELIQNDALVNKNKPDGLMLGAGARMAISDQLRMRAEYDWFDVDDADLWSINLGIEYLFGRVAEAKPAAQPAPPPPPPPPPADSDGDGVPDSADQCPGTPAGTKVDERGCELDSDGDGVVDRMDECPDTPAGARVDARGCEEELVLRGVNFETNSATLTPQDRLMLDSVADILKKRPNFAIEVQGHTDSRGADAYNMGLSERRADAVRDYLIGQGIAAEKLTATGFGESTPIASNDTDEGRAQNRRVTLEFTQQPAQ